MKKFISTAVVSTAYLAIILLACWTWSWISKSINFSEKIHAFNQLLIEISPWLFFAWLAFMVAISVYILWYMFKSFIKDIQDVYSAIDLLGIKDTN